MPPMMAGQGVCNGYFCRFSILRRSRRYFRMVLMRMCFRRELLSFEFASSRRRRSSVRSINAFTLSMVVGLVGMCGLDDDCSSG
jgi:hypothetical protein